MNFFFVLLINPFPIQQLIGTLDIDSLMAKNSASTISEAQAEFALKLLRELLLVKRDESPSSPSTILSPISVALVLSMIYAGAIDETAEEMGQLLAEGAHEAKVHQYFGKLVHAILLSDHRNNDNTKNYELEGANKVYIKSGFPILDAFQTAIDRHYGGLFESVNFLKKAATAKKINDFVKRATHDKISELIDESMINEETRLILVNAVYFKAEWVDKFDPDWTEKRTFYISEHNSQQVDMMRQTNYFIYADTETFQVLGMPYGMRYYVGEHAAHMFILLPKQRFGLGQVLANLSGTVLIELFQQNRHKVEVIVSVPKFKLESSHNMKEALKSLGMARAFSDRAQFDGITASTPLQISHVIQKAFIEFNEEGTVAAAATFADECCGCSGVPPPPAIPRFNADHPFAFFLVSNDNSSSSGQTTTTPTTLLFNGVYSG